MATPKRVILQAEIDALREAEAESSPGPWHDASRGGTWGQWWFFWSGGRRHVGAAGDLRGVDARFIVLAKELVPKLLAEVKRLQRENERLKRATPPSDVKAKAARTGGS